jgi:hypothetical protein
MSLRARLARRARSGRPARPDVPAADFLAHDPGDDDAPTVRDADPDAGLTAERRAPIGPQDTVIRIVSVADGRDEEGRSGRWPSRRG